MICFKYILKHNSNCNYIFKRLKRVEFKLPNCGMNKENVIMKHICTEQ